MQCAVTANFLMVTPSLPAMRRAENLEAAGRAWRDIRDRQFRLLLQPCGSLHYAADTAAQRACSGCNEYAGDWLASTAAIGWAAMVQSFGPPFLGR